MPKANQGFSRHRGVLDYFGGFIGTTMHPPTTIPIAGETDASSAEEQLARDNQSKATNCRWGGCLSSAIPFYDSQRQFRALLCLKKPDKIVPPKADSIPAESRKSLLTVKRICPIHAEPVHLHAKFHSGLLVKL